MDPVRFLVPPILILFSATTAIGQATPGLRSVPNKVAVAAIASEGLGTSKDLATGASLDRTNSSEADADTYVLNTTVEVHDGLDATDQNATATYSAAAEDIMSSAGTYGDFSRYVQLFPGVISNDDQSNNMLVRGGKSFRESLCRTWI